MRVCVTGGREYPNQQHVFDVLHILRSRFGITSLACGGARGVDAFAKFWAMNYLTPEQVVVFYADWTRYGKIAGRIRNNVMLSTFKPDLLIAFPGGNGTYDCVKKANAQGIAVLDLRRVVHGIFADRQHTDLLVGSGKPIIIYDYFDEPKTT